MVSAAASIMRPESHPWLNWPGCNQARRIELNNELAELQHRSFSQPRLMDWNVCNSLGIGAELAEMFNTRLERQGMVLDIPIWSRVFNLREDIYREWCLEFFSSLRVEKEFQAHEMHSDKLITFRLGGNEHELTLLEFGLHTSLFSASEVANTGSMMYYLAYGELDSSDFSEDQAWVELTGMSHHSSLSKIKDVRSPILRVIHKMLTYSFVHRATQQDKVYADDLWMLHKFSKRDPTQYINVVWTLVCYLEQKAKGRSSNSQICCGHFVTRLAKGLGLFTRANIQRCSPAIKWRYITKRDLEISGLIHPSGNRLIDEGPLPGMGEQQPQQRRQRRGSMSEEIFRIGGMMNRMGFQVDQMGQQLTGLTGYTEYHMNRYQPTLEEMTLNRHASSSSSTVAWDPYAPPPLYYPQPYQEPEQEEGDEEEDDE